VLVLNCVGNQLAQTSAGSIITVAPVVFVPELLTTWMLIEGSRSLLVAVDTIVPGSVT
jgi:hypothetical protein